jgi:hypothetical protein
VHYRALGANAKLLSVIAWWNTIIKLKYEVICVYDSWKDGVIVMLYIAFNNQIPSYIYTLPIVVTYSQEIPTFIRETK